MAVAQSPGSGLDWHGNWHQITLALSRLDPRGNYLPLRHVRNAWDLWHGAFGPLTGNNLDIRDIPGNASPVPGIYRVFPRVSRWFLRSDLSLYEV